jgi:hypothetical protein
MKREFPDPERISKSNGLRLTMEIFRALFTGNVNRIIHPALLVMIKN